MLTKLRPANILLLDFGRALLPSLCGPALADAIATKNIQPADGCQSGSSGSTAIRASGGIAMVSTYGWWSAPVGE